MKVGLLRSGEIDEEAAGGVGSYLELFTDILAPHGIDLVPFDAPLGHLPASVDDADGWLVSGSIHSAYDALPWLAPFEDLLRDIASAERPLVGVCFGHQLIAQALGGRVERAPGGWGVGVHRYDLVATEWWMDPPRPQVHLVASHQDQVVDLPAGAAVVARTDHCEVAAFTVGERILCMQPHPEFTPELSRRLTTMRRGSLGDALADEALASLATPVDNEVVGRWIATFLAG